MCVSDKIKGPARLHRRLKQLQPLWSPPMSSTLMQFRWTGTSKWPSAVVQVTDGFNSNKKFSNEQLTENEAAVFVDLQRIKKKGKSAQFAWKVNKVLHLGGERQQAGGRSDGRVRCRLMSGFFFFFLRCGPTPKSVHQFGQKVTHTLTHWHTGHTDPRRGAKGWPADQSLPVSTGSVRPRTRRRICCGWRSEGAWSPPPLVPSRSRPSAAGQSANGPSGHPFFLFLLVGLLVMIPESCPMNHARLTLLAVARPPFASFPLTLSSFAFQSSRSWMICSMKFAWPWTRTTLNVQVASKWTLNLVKYRPLNFLT